MQLVAGEIELAVGSKSNPKAATRKKNKTTGEDTTEALFKSSDAKVLDVKILTGNTLDECILSMQCLANILEEVCN